MYKEALSVLSKKRWSITTQSDIRTAYVNLERAAQLGHLDAEKILGCYLLFTQFFKLICKLVKLQHFHISLATFVGA